MLYDFFTVLPWTDSAKARVDNTAGTSEQITAVVIVVLTSIFSLQK